MKFLVDAQLPRRLASWLVTIGHEALHTPDLPEKNRTSDEKLRNLAKDGLWVMVTKDSDFVDSFLLRGSPPKLLFVATGNIANDELLTLFQANLRMMTDALLAHDFVEIDQMRLTIHA